MNVRRWALVLVMLLVLAACGREREVSFGESSGGDGLGQHVEGGQGGFGDADEPAAEDPDGSGEGSDAPEAAAPAEGVTVSPGSTGADPAGGGSGGSGGTGRSEPGAVATIPPGSASPAPSSEPGEDGYTQPRPGQADVRAREWESAEVQPDDRSVVVTWWSGVEPCTVLDRVEVVEHADRIVITLYEGRDPEFEGGCAAVAVQRRTKVTVSSPVAGREIVDGAKAKPGA